MRFLILHGWQGSGPEHWQTLARRTGCAPPDTTSSTPSCRPATSRARTAGAIAFRSELGRLAARQDDERVVVAHSLGCVLWLREAANVAPSRRVDRVALVAPPCPGAAVPELAGFYPTGAEREAVAAAAGETRLVCTDDDPYCPGENAARFWAQPLGLAVDLLPGARAPQRRGGLRPVAGDGGVVPGRARRARPRWPAGGRLIRARAKNGAEM